MIKRILGSSLLFLFPFFIHAQCTDLFISEYMEGSGNNKCLEIYNPTTSAIDLTGYSIAIYSNGNNTTTNIITLMGSIAGNDVFVVCRPGVDNLLVPVSIIDSLTSKINFNGNDAVVLLNGIDTLDIIGLVGVDPDPSNEWRCSVGSDISTENHTIVRKSSVLCGNPDGFDMPTGSTVFCNDWIGFPEDNASDLGRHEYDGLPTFGNCTFEAPVFDDFSVCNGESTLMDLTDQASSPVFTEEFLLDFESAGGYTTSIPEFTDNDSDYFIRTDSTDFANNINYLNTQGDFFFAANDIDGEGASLPVELNITGIDITGGDNLLFFVYLAEDDDGTNESWDDADFVHFQYQIDGGGYMPLLHIEGEGGTNMKPRIDDNFDGTGEGFEITDIFTEFQAKINGTGAMLDLKVIFNLNSGDEDIAIDDIRVVSSDIPQTSFNFYESDPQVIAPKVAEEVLVYNPELTTVDSPDTFYITQTDGDCESLPTRVIIMVNPIPSVIASADNVEHCEGEDISLLELGGQASTWSWTGPLDFISSAQNPMILSAGPDATGKYIVTGTDDNMCSSASEVNIVVYEALSAAEISPVIACTAEEATITPPPAIIRVPTTACDLFISEYIEGSGDNKCLELYNGTGADIDMSDYSIEIYRNGSTSVSASFDLEGTIGADSTYVICNVNSSSIFTDLADTTTNSNALSYNGDDVVTLVKNGNAIDIIGKIGEDPGTRWVAENGAATRDRTLLRKSDTACGDMDGTDDFDPSFGFTALPLDDASNLGVYFYNGLEDQNVTFNFYETDPSVDPMAIPVAADVDSYFVGQEDTIYVTSNYRICEGPVTIVPVLISDGIRQFSCNTHINVSLGSSCKVPVSAIAFMKGDIRPEFIKIEISDFGGNILTDESLSDFHLDQILTYKAIDMCNGQSCWGEIRLQDKKGPEIIIEDEFLDCGDSSAESDLDPVIITDCSEYTYSFKDRYEGDLCDDNKKIVRTFTAIDIHGNVSVAIQNISFRRRTLDEILPPTEIVITDCGIIDERDIEDHTGNIRDAYPTIDGKPLKEGEFCNFIIYKKDKVLDVCGEGCNNSVKIARVWHIIDWCDSESTRKFEQIISAKDTLAPVVSTQETSVAVSVDPWSCVNEAVKIPFIPAIDNCTGDISYIFTGPVGIRIENGTAHDLPYGVHTFYYYASDCCGNVSKVGISKIIVVDEVAPIAIAKENIVVTLSSYLDDGDEEGIAKLFPAHIDNLSYDNCSNVSYRVKRESDPCRTDSDEYGPFVTFCCSDVGRELKVWLEVRDTSGNVSETWANVKVEDKEVKIECIEIIVNCDEDLEAAISNRRNKPTASGICRNKSVELVDRDESEYNATCHSGVIYLTYAVRGFPTITCVQSVIVNYNGGFSCDDVEWPEAYRTETCMEFPEPSLTIHPQSCELIGWTYHSETYKFNTDACAKIINSYTVVDWCIYDQAISMTPVFDYIEGGTNCNAVGHSGNPGVFNYTETIKIIDTIAPVIRNCSYDPVIITQGCSAPVIITNFAIDNTDCPNKILSWLLTIKDKNDNVYIYERFSQSGRVIIINLEDIPFVGPRNEYEVLWKVWDGCGNVDSCQTTLTVIDKKSPQPYCKDLASAVMDNGQAELWAIDFDLGSTDNCSDQNTLLFTFDGAKPDYDNLEELHYFDESGIIADTAIGKDLYLLGQAQKWLPSKRSSARIFNCDNLGDNLFKMSVWDEEMNTDFCMVNLNLSAQDGDCATPSTVMIAGDISRYNGTAINGVEVAIVNMFSNENNTYLSDENGHFEHLALEQHHSFKIYSDKIDDPKNGITTADVLFAQDFFINNSFPSPYAIIAADVNEDHRISSIDLLLIQKMALGIIDHFDAGIWKFVDKESIRTVENALLEYQTEKEIINVTSDIMDNHFIGVKIGDLDLDAIVNLRDPRIKTRNSNSIAWTLEDHFVEKGEILQIQILHYADNVYGFQAAIETKGLSIQNVESNNLSNLLSKTSPNKALVNYADAAEPIFTNELFTIEVRAEKSGNLSDMISISNDAFTSSAYVGSTYQAYDLSLSFSQKPSSSFTVSQNTPNPFSSESTIEFTLPEKGTVTFEIFGVDGKSHHSDNSSYERGLNKINIDKEGLNSGIYYYRLHYKNLAITKKMVIIE